MRRNAFLGALATGALLVTAASAPAQRFGFGYGHGDHRPYSTFGFVYRDYPRTEVVYRYPLEGDVEYAERASNDFRHDYERRNHDPLGVKSEVQRLDETLEKARREAEAFGGVTERGRDLLRDALDAEDRIDRRFRRADDPMRRDWDELRRRVDRLAREYRVD